MINDLYFDLPSQNPKIEDGKPIIVIMKSEDNKPYLLDLLKNIIKALKYNFEEDVYLHVHDERSFLLKNIPNNCHYLLSFGVNFEEINLNINQTEYYIHKLDKIKIIYAPQLEELHKDQNKKSKLWKSLQLMFEILKN
jgi:hypothetical protein